MLEKSENLQKEITSLKDEIDRIADSTNFNGINLLDGSLADTTKALKISGKIAGKEIVGANDGTGKITYNLSATFKDGDSVTINGKTYTYKNGADGNDGKTFGSLAQLATATLKNGVKLETGTNTKVTAGYNTPVDNSLTLQIGDTSADFNQMKVSVGDMHTAALGIADIDISTQQGAKDAVDLIKSAINMVSSADFNQMKVSVGDMHTAALGIADIDISTQQGAKDAVDLIKSAINMVSSTRGDLGAIQNRLEHTINNLSVTAENMTAAESRIRDVDMANEMMAYTKNNILVQSSQAMLAQANQIPQGVLQLLQ